MDSALRDARIRKFCGSSNSLDAGSSSLLSAPAGNSSASASIPAGNSSASASIPAGNSSASASVPAGAQTADIDPVYVLNLLVQIKNILEGLPAAIAAAVSTNLATSAVANQATQQLIHAEIPSANGHNENDGGEDCCGVCHMPLGELDTKWAFDQCGHYPYCTACVEQIKHTKCCPYCSVKGEALALKLE